MDRLYQRIPDARFESDEQAPARAQLLPGGSGFLFLPDEHQRPFCDREVFRPLLRPGLSRLARIVSPVISTMPSWILPASGPSTIVRWMVIGVFEASTFTVPRPLTSPPTAC